MSHCGHSLNIGESVADKAVTSSWRSHRSYAGQFGLLLALALMAICPASLSAQSSQGVSSQSSPAEPSDRFRLGGAQTKDPAADAQPAQCKKDEDENKAWRPKESVLVDDSATKQTSPAAKTPAAGNQIPPARGMAPANPAPSPIPPVALLGATIIYSDGKLAIRAHDVALNEILDAIKERTGVMVEYPPQGAADRVFVDIQLMPMQDALTALLDGSRFNYILALGSNRQFVKQVILSNKNSQSNVAVASASSSSAVEPTVYQGYSGEGGSNSLQTATPEIAASAPRAIPTIPASLGLSVSDDDLKKPPAQLLDELQKRQIRQLESQAAAAAAQATQP